VGLHRIVGRSSRVHIRLLLFQVGIYINIYTYLSKLRKQAYDSRDGIRNFDFFLTDDDVIESRNIVASYIQNVEQRFGYIIRVGAIGFF